jgi:hypothetical protein
VSQPPQCWAAMTRGVDKCHGVILLWDFPPSNHQGSASTTLSALPCAPSGQYGHLGRLDSLRSSLDLWILVCSLQRGPMKIGSRVFTVAKGSMLLAPVFLLCLDTLGRALDPL